MASMTCIYAGSSVIPLGTAWGSDPGDISWGPGYREYSCQTSLGGKIIED